MLTVGELRDFLDKQPDSMAVVISADEEGNEVHHIGGISLSCVEDVTQYSLEEVHPYDIEGTEDEVIILW